MIKPQFILPLSAELIVDLFAGGGGASTGIEQATGRHVDIAVNHDPQAVSLHTVNHPQTKHFCSDVFEVNPLVVTDGQPVGLLWASPDCKHFSKAKGGKPVSKKIRGLAWVVIKWAKLVKPRIICLENVEEFQTWGPLLADGMPCPDRKGKTYQRWRKQLENLGYVVETRELRASEYGVPTIRKRFFLVARCDGAPIVWPAKTHGPGLKPFKTAADCIDFSLPCPSIFERTKPLAEATQRRIAHGIKRYVIDSAKPFIVGLAHGDHSQRPGSRVTPVEEPLRTVHAGGGNFALAAPTIARIGQTGGKGKYSNSVAEPLTTITTKAEHLLVSPSLIQTGYGEREGQAPRVLDLHKPLGTAVGGQKHALVAAFLAKHFGGEPAPGKTAQDLRSPAPTVMATGGPQALVSAALVGVGGRAGQSRPRGIDEPTQTITAKGDSAVVTSHLAKLRGTSNSAATDEPLGTVSAQGQHHAEVRALLMKYYGSQQDPKLDDPLHTVTAKDRFGLVTVDCVDYYIADIGMRMLQPRELYRAQGFPDSYCIDRGADGAPLPKDAQVRMCGNSVCPPLARAIVAANFSEQSTLREAA